MKAAQILNANASVQRRFRRMKRESSCELSYVEGYRTERTVHVRRRTSGAVLPTVAIADRHVGQQEIVALLTRRQKKLGEQKPFP